MSEQTSNEQQNKAPEETPEQRDAHMAQKYRSQLAGQVDPLQSEDDPQDDKGGQKPERPANVPEKFWDAEKGEIRVEELLKSNSELEKKLGQKPADPKPKEGDGTGNEGQDGDGQKPDDGNKPDPVAEAVKGFNALREQATGRLASGEELTDEMYQGFEKHGLSRDDVDAFIAGQQAIGQLAAMQVHNEVGGEKQYQQMIEWARSNFDEKEIEVYDRDIHSADTAVRLTAARGLAARYAQAMGTEGKSVTDGHGGKTNNGYASGAEMRADMCDPRYQTDEAFRAQVQRKVEAAMRAGVNLRA